MIRRLSVLIMSIGVIFALVLAPTASSADEATPNPVTEIVQKVKDLVQPKNIQAAVDAPPATEDDDTPPNETEDPVGPDHASTRGLDLRIGEQPLVGLNHNNATIEDNDATHADSAALSLFGAPKSSARPPAMAVVYSATSLLESCSIPSAPAVDVCVDALYSEAGATEDGSTSNSYAKSGILNVCAFGGDALALPGGGGAGGLG